MFECDCVRITLWQFVTAIPQPTASPLHLNVSMVFLKVANCKWV